LPVGKDAISEHALDQALRFCFAVAPLHAHQRKDAATNRRYLDAIDCDARV